MSIPVVVVGAAGEAYRKHYNDPLLALQARGDVRVAGLVDPVRPDLLMGRNYGLRDIQWWPTVAEIPADFITSETVAMVLTPDHWPIIQELADMGFRGFFVEKPLVSRDAEIPLVLDLRDKLGLQLYAADFYIPKLYTLQVVLGKMKSYDPRMKFVREVNPESFGFQPSMRDTALGEIQGIAIQIIEAGDFCLPDLEKRPWLKNDPEIGGMLRDLGTHAFAPLIMAWLLNVNAHVHSANLSRISDDRKGLTPLRSADEVEMYAEALLTTSAGIPLQVALGKVPFQGGIWSLAIWGSKGMFCAGLRTGQPSVLVSNSGQQFVLALARSPAAIALEEALMYFRGEIPGFDGNVGAFVESMNLLGRIRTTYFSSP